MSAEKSKANDKGATSNNDAENAANIENSENNTNQAENNEQQRQRETPNNQTIPNNNTGFQESESNVNKEANIVGTTAADVGEVNNEKQRTQLAELNTPLASDENLKRSPSLLQSELFVLHTKRGTGVVHVNRRCHLPRSEGVNVKARRKLIVASVMCLFFVFCEVIGGILSNSLAVAADAAHTLTDFAGFMISLFAIWLAGRKPTDRLSFGWYRAEVIGALASVMTIWFVTAILVWLAIERCIKQDFDIDAMIMIITSVFGIITNIIVGVYLSWGSNSVEMNLSADEPQVFSHGHSHGHHHSNGCFNKVQKNCSELLCFKRKRHSCEIDSIPAHEHHHKNVENINVKAAILHVLGDMLQSVGVLVAGIIIYYQPTWIIADPICTFLFSAIILYTTTNILKDIIVVLMEGTPTYMDYNAVQATFEQIPGVKSIHHLRIWALSLEKVALAVHLVIHRGYDPNEILIKAEEAIHKHYRLFETTIQIEVEHDERDL